MGAILMRRGRTAPMVVIALFAALFVFVGGTYAIGNGIHVGVGDFVFAYVGPPVALALVVMSVLSVKRPVRT
jgi:hypothetical protein